MTPTSEPNLNGSQVSVHSRPRTRLEAILDKATPKVKVNNSTHSIKELIDATEPVREMQNGSAVSVRQGE